MPISGKQLARLLERDGWTARRRSTHGIFYTKRSEDGIMRHTVVPDKSDPLPTGTLGEILGPKQTGIGRDGLDALVQRHGLR